LTKTDERGFRLKKHMTGTITDNKDKRLFERNINTVNETTTINNNTLSSLLFNLNSKTTMILQVIESRQANKLGFNIVPTGNGAPFDNCTIPIYASLNETDKRTIRVIIYDSVLIKWKDNLETE
jgi:hypothetical protein